MSNTENENEENTIATIAGAIDFFAAMSDIPGAGVLSLTAQASKYISTLHTNRMLKNFTAFFKETGKGTKEQRERLKQTLGAGHDETMEDLLLTISNLDKEKKAQVIGKLYKGLLNDQVSKNDFKKLVKMVEQAYIDTLNALLNSEFASHAAGHNANTRQELAALGLATIGYKLETDGVRARTMGAAASKPVIITDYSLSPLGVVLYDIVSFGKTNPTEGERLNNAESKRGNR
jgi:hypothetical protein